MHVWVCVLFIYTIFISFICVSLEEAIYIASHQQIYDFYKRIIFEEKRHGKWFFYINELFIQCNKNNCCCCEHIRGGVNIYKLVHLSMGPWVCYVCIHDIKSEYQQQTMCHTSVNLLSHCIKHTSMSFWY